MNSTTSGGIIVTVDVASQRGTSLALRFSVLDTGVGMPDDKVKDLFEPLTQKTSAFGLAICQKIVQLMGGAIEVQSRLGAGTAVSFTADFHALVEYKAVELPPLACSAGSWSLPHGGVDGFLAKPIEIDAVLNIIAAIALGPAHT